VVFFASSRNQTDVITANALDGVWIAALAISIAATLTPARAASHILPLDILRYE
jgi:ABC-type lipoprotein release transport system permease subunit